MNNKTYIVTESDFDSLLLNHLLIDFSPHLEFISGKGPMSALGIARTMLEQNRVPLLLVLDADTTDAHKFMQRRQKAESYIGTTQLNSLLRIVWAEPELEILFLRNPSGIFAEFNTELQLSPYHSSFTRPKEVLDKAIQGDSKSFIRKNLRFIDPKMFQEDEIIRSIKEFLDISRNVPLELSNENPVKYFSLHSRNAFLAITHLQIPTLLGKKPSEWFNELSANDITLTATIETEDHNHKFEFGVRHLHMMVSPYHAQPAFDEYILFNNSAGESTLRLEAKSKDPNYKFNIQLLYDCSNDAKVRI